MTQKALDQQIPAVGSLLHMSFVIHPSLTKSHRSSVVEIEETCLIGESINILKKEYLTLVTQVR